MIRINNLTVQYGSSQIISNLSLDLKLPGFFLICGNNGCGKSTFLKAIASKVDYAGDIDTNGKSIIYLAQNNNLNFNIGVKELLLMGLYDKKHFLLNYSKQDVEEVLTLLGKFDLQYLIDKNFQEISGGEQQLVWLMQILLQEKDVYLIDEPTQNLDLRNAQIVYEIIQNLVCKKNKTVLCVSHDLTSFSKMQGNILNLSMEHPAVESINPTSIDRHIEFLRQKSNRSNQFKAL